jgi:hypothetical protein
VAHLSLPSAKGCHSLTTPCQENVWEGDHGPEEASQIRRWTFLSSLTFLLLCKSCSLWGYSFLISACVFIGTHRPECTCAVTVSARVCLRERVWRREGERGAEVGLNDLYRTSGTCNSLIPLTFKNQHVFIERGLPVSHCPRRQLSCEQGRQVLPSEPLLSCPQTFAISHCCPHPPPSAGT